MNKPEEKSESEYPERVILDEWVCEPLGPPTPGLNIELGMNWLQPRFEIAYDVEE